MTYNAYLNRVVDYIFNEAAKHYTWSELASEAGISYTTVHRLGTRKTKYPQLRTIFLLCKATNISIDIYKHKKVA